MTPEQERRKRRFRRDVNDLVRGPDGKVSEAKFWTNVGKGITAFLLVKHVDSLLDRPEALIILLTVLILPKLFEKMLNLKYNAAKP